MLWPGPSKRIRRNPISPLSKWKIFDNIRRSLLPIALLAMLLFGWVYSHSPVFWTLAVLSILLLNSAISFFWEVWQKPEDVHVLPHIIMSFHYTIQHFLHQVFLLITIPFEAFLYADAIWRTNWRMIISHSTCFNGTRPNLMGRANKNLFRTMLKCGSRFCWPSVFLNG
jgi:hypothetical protein